MGDDDHLADLAPPHAGIEPWWHGQHPLLAHPMGAWLNASAPSLHALVPTPTPKFQIADRPNRFEVYADLAGFDTRHIEVETVGRRLVIRGGAEGAPEAGSSLHPRAPFTRAVILPEDVEDSIRRASLDGTVLTVVLSRYRAGFWRMLLLRVWRWLRNKLTQE